MRKKNFVFLTCRSRSTEFILRRPLSTAMSQTKDVEYTVTEPPSIDVVLEKSQKSLSENLSQNESDPDFDPCTDPTVDRMSNMSQQLSRTAVSVREMYKSLCMYFHD